MTSNDHAKNPEAVARGLKAATHNANVSPEAKMHAAERLEEMGIKSDILPSNDTLDTTKTTGRANTAAQDAHAEDVHNNRVIGGYKATLNNDNVSDAAKKHAQEILEAAGYTVERADTTTEDEHNSRVLAGYKAALSNPHVSAEAKAHAAEYLAKYDTI